MQANTQALPAGTLLQGEAYRYRIDSVLGTGSFGVTYSATAFVRVQGPLGEIETEMRVAIKEFFMQEISTRDATGAITESSDGSLVQRYADKFRTEARNLSRLSHEGIVRVLDFIEANHTCYYVMEHVEGESLDEYACRRGGLPEQEALAAIREVAAALAYMHEARMLHLDLKPRNVMRRAADGHLFLIDFGLSKQYDDSGEPESSTAVGLGTPGYAPIEQANEQNGRDFAPTLDVYALGATLYKVLTATAPPKSSDVLNEGLPTDRLAARGVTSATIRAIEQAMQPRRRDRLQSVRDFLALLPGGEEGTQVRPQAAPMPPRAKAKKTEGKKKAADGKRTSAAGKKKPVLGRPAIFAGVGAGVLALLIGVGLAVADCGGRAADADLAAADTLAADTVVEAAGPGADDCCMLADKAYVHADSLLKKANNIMDDAAAAAFFAAFEHAVAADSLASAAGAQTPAMAMDRADVGQRLLRYYSAVYNELMELGDDPIYEESKADYTAKILYLKAHGAGL